MDLQESRVVPEGFDCPIAGELNAEQLSRYNDLADQLSDAKARLEHLMLADSFGRERTFRLWVGTSLQWEKTVSEFKFSAQPWTTLLAILEEVFQSPLAAVSVLN